MGRRLAMLAATVLAGGVVLTGCADAQEACDGLNIGEADAKAADAATRAGFEVEKEVDNGMSGTAECVWDVTEQRLVGSSDSE